MPSPLDRYRSRYFGTGGSPLDRYRQRYGFSTGPSAPPPEEDETFSLGSELWRRTKEVGGGILNATGAGSGAIAGGAAALFGSDVYQRTLMRKAQEAALFDGGEDPDVFQGLEMAPKVGELLTEGWQPESKGGQALKNITSLGATLATDPGSWLGAGVGPEFIGPLTQAGKFLRAPTGAARGFGLGAALLYGPDTAKGAYEGATGAYESLKEGNVADAAAQGLEATLMTGLAAMMAKGTISEVQALRAMRRGRGQNPNVDPTVDTTTRDAWLNEDDTGEPVSAAEPAPVEDRDFVYPEPDPVPDRDFLYPEPDPVEDVDFVYPDRQGPIPEVFKDAPGVSTEGRVFTGGEEGPLTSVSTRARTFVGGPDGLRVAAPMAGLGEVPAMRTLPDGSVVPEVMDRFGEPPTDEYIPQVFRQEAELLPEVVRTRRPRKAKVVAEAPVEAAPEVEDPGAPGTPFTDVLGRTTTYDQRIAQLDEWIQGMDDRLAEGQDPSLESLRGELVAERERLAAPGKKGSLVGARETPRINPEDALPTGDIPAEPVADTIPEPKAGRARKPESREQLLERAKRAEKTIDDLLSGEPLPPHPDISTPRKPKVEAAPPVEPLPVVEAPPTPDAPAPEPSSGPDPAEVARLSKEGYRAREIAQKLGANIEEIRIIRKEQGVSIDDVKAGAAKRFAKPEVTPPVEAAQEAAPAPVPEAPATPATRDPLSIAQEFLAGKETVTVVELREGIKDGWLAANGKPIGSLELNSTLRRLETLGIIEKSGGKTRKVRPSAESESPLPAEAASVEEAGLAAPETTAIPPDAGTGEATGVAAPEAPAPAPVEAAAPAPTLAERAAAANKGKLPVKGLRPSDLLPQLSDTIPMADLVKGGVYKVRFGNFDKAVYVGDGNFIGIREKGSVRKLEGGPHPEINTETGMSVQPLEKVGQVPADILLRRLVSDGSHNKRLFDYLDKGEQAAPTPTGRTIKDQLHDRGLHKAAREYRTPAEVAAEPVAPVEATPLSPEAQAKQDLYIDPETGEIRPEIQQQVRSAASKAMGKRSRTFDEVYRDMVSALPEIVDKFDPAQGKLTQHVLKQLGYRESKAWRSAQGQKDKITLASGLETKVGKAEQSIADVKGVEPNQETGLREARKTAQEKALYQAMESLDPKERLIAQELDGLGGSKSGDEVGAMFKISRQAINKIKAKIITKLAASMKELGHTNFEGHTPDSLSPDGWTVSAAEAVGAVHPIDGTKLTFVDTPNLPEGHAAEMAAARETRKLGSLFTKMYDELQETIGTATRSTFSGFMAGTNALGVQIGDKVTRADGRTFLNLFRHAEAAFNNPVKGLHAQEFSSSVVDTMVHEVLHNTFPHGPEMKAAEAAMLDRLLRDGTYAKLTNQVKQTVNAYDGYLLKWLRERADFAEKNYGKPESTPVDVRGTGEGGAAPRADRQGAGAVEAGAGRGGEAPTARDLQRGNAGAARDLGASATVRGGGADTVRRDLGRAEAYRVEARLDDDPVIRAARDAFTDTTIKDISPHKLMSMMPELGGKITPDVLLEVMDAADTIGPPPPNAKPGGVPDSPLNITRVIADNDLKTKMLAMDAVLTKHGLFDRQHPQSWASTEELLDALGEFKNNKELVAHIKRYGATPREMTLLRMMHVFQATKTRAAHDNFRLVQGKLEAAAEKGNVTPEMIEAVKNAGADKFIQSAHLTQLSLDTSGQKTKIARLLASLRQPVDGMDPEMANFTAHARFMKALELQGVGKDVRQQLHELLVSKDPGAYDEFTKLFRASMQYSTTEKLMEAYVAGLVSGIPTKIANFTSNAIFRGVRDTENLLAVGTDFVRSKITNTPRERFLGEAAAALGGYKFHMAEAAKDWVSAHGEIATLKPMQVRGLRFISGTPLDEVFRSGGKIQGKLGELLRYGFKSMEADDGLFKHMAGGQELWRRIYRQGRQGGADHAEAIAAIEPRVKEIVAAYESGSVTSLGKDTIAMLKDVNRQVLSDTFQSPLEGLMAKLQLISNHHPLSKLLVPFIKTPTNIFIQTWKRTPMGLLQALAEKGKYTQGQFAEELSKGIMGTTIAASVALMAYQWANNPEGEHQITGSGPLDPKLNAQLRATGWQPYSFKINDRYVPFTRFEPISSVMGIAADMAHAAKDGEFQNINKLGARLVKSATTNLANKTFISGITAAAQAWSEPDRYMERFVSQFESGLIPLSGLSRTLTRAVDPTYRETGFSDSKYGLAAPILANIPGASRLLPEQFDPSGAPRKRPGVGGFGIPAAVERAASPIPSTVEDRTPKGKVLRLLTDVGYAPVVKDNYSSKKFGSVPLTPTEKTALYKAHAQANKVLEVIVDDPTFLALPDSSDDPESFGGRKTKEDIIRSVHNKYYQSALKGILPELQQRAYAKNKPKPTRG